MIPNPFGFNVSVTKWYVKKKLKKYFCREILGKRFPSQVIKSTRDEVQERRNLCELSYDESNFIYSKIALRLRILYHIQRNFWILSGFLFWYEDIKQTKKGAVARY